MLLTNARPPAEGVRRRSKGKEVIRWIETHCVGTVGKWAKKPAKLMPWQKLFIMHLFEQSEDGRRRYRWALLGIPKKNGKTELAAWLGLYFLIGDGEPAPLIAVAASADHQADLVFGAAKRCAEWSPTLRHITVTHERDITVPSIPGAKLVRVAASSGTNDGPSWHVVICDEFHEWQGKRGRDTHTVLTNGVGARDQPLILQITTAGFDVDGTVCGEHFRLGEALAADPAVDPAYLFWWYQADLTPDPETGELPDFRDPRVWESANPSWGITLPDPVSYLGDQVTKKTEAEFKRYFLNLWVMAEDIWLPEGAWFGCRAEEGDLGLYWGEDGELALSPLEPVFVGVDGGLKRDSFAIVGTQWQGERLVTKAWIWENPYPPGHSLHGQWKLNLRDPVNRLREMRDEHPEPALEGTPGPAYGYDPRFLEYVAQELTDEGLNMIEVPQTDARMCPASELLYVLILEGTIAHDGDPAFDRQIHSSVQKQKDRGWRIARPTGTRRNNDAAIAAAMSVQLAHTEGEDDDVDIF